MFKRTLLYVVVMLILLALAVSAGQWGESTALLESQATKLSVWLQKQSLQAENGTGLGTQLVHQEDSLITWSNNNILPAGSDLKKLAARNGYFHYELPQGVFLAHVEKTGSESRTTLVPIQYRQPTAGGQDTLICPKEVPCTAQIIFSEVEKSNYPIRVGNQDIGWLSARKIAPASWLVGLQLAAWLLFLGLFLSLLGQWGRALGAKLGWLAGASLVALVATGLLWLSIKTGFTTQQFGSLSLFKPSFQQASLIGNSVGDWLLHVSILVFIMSYFHQTPLPTRTEKGGTTGFLLTVVSQALAMLSVLIGSEALRQMVFQRRTGFDFDSFLNLGLNGFLALAGVVGLMVGLFLFSHRLIIGVQQYRLHRNQRLVAIGVATLIFTAMSTILLPTDVNLLLIILFRALYALSMDAFVHWDGGGFGWAICWLVLFSLFSSTQLSGFYQQRDQNIRESYAQSLANHRDTLLTEKILPQVVQEIQSDTAKLGRMLKPWPFKAHALEIRDYVNRTVYQHPYLFQHYRLSAFAFDKADQPILLGQTLGYEQVVLGNWATAKPLSGNPHIRVGQDSEGNLRYLALFSVNRMEDPEQSATLYLFFDLTHPVPTRTFSKLFFNSPLKNLSQLPRYDFSVTQNGRTTVDQGLANRALLGIDQANGTVVAVQSGQRIDAIAKSADGQTIAAVGRTSGGWIKRIFLFSIIFTLAALCLLALALLNSWLEFLPKTYEFRLTTRGSLAKRIHFWNVSLLAISFFVVGFLTYQHFTRSAQDTERTDFNYRAKALLTNLTNQALSSAISDDSLRQAIPAALASISSSLGMDAQFYNPNGQLIFSTQEELVKLGVLPSKMNPQALAFLQKNPSSERTETEQSSGISFSTQYRPLQNGRGALIGILGVPYSQSTGYAGAEVSDFIGMLASLYVFLLLIAFGVTFFLARSITRPVSLLSEKVRVLRLEDKNEPLAYEGDSEDEISQLIGQYNTMVEKLESSKTQLVKLEREGAWREMARQVAHDIKNPLTTMKLSMQQLERLSGNPEQAAAYLRKAITRLIEQIDSLAQIASEFSMFANLDIKSKQDVVINDVVESVHDLFSEQKQVELSLTLPERPFHILGDKNHLIRVFNNLVINAIQAIPSDRKGVIKVSLYQEGPLAVVRISDNGGGIPPEIRERVFEPNFTTKTSGSGLGLAICKKIIEAHDGDIRFETRDDAGTDFFIEMPLVSGE